MYVRLSGVAPFILPSPAQVGRVALDSAGVLGPHLLTTLTEAGLGLLFGAVAGFVLAILVVLIPLLRQGIYPLLVFSQTVPIIVLAPLLIIWTGYGLTPKIILVAMTVFFPVLVTTVTAMENVPTALLDLINGLGGNWRAQLLLIRLPAGIPGALSGLRLAATYTIGAAVVAEYMAGESGLGVYIQRSRKAFAVDQIFVAVALIALLTAALFILVDRLAALATPWQQSPAHSSEKENHHENKIHRRRDRRAAAGRLRQ